MLSSIEFMAVVVAALYGILAATRKSLDVVGIFVISFSVAFGGGTVRDLFLDRHPLFWITNDHYLMIVLAIAIAGSLMPRLVARAEPYLAVPDAIGMALFTVTGAGFALQAGTSPFIAMFLGAVTGTFGGVIADVLCNEIPSVFRSSPLYATCSFLGGGAYVAVRLFGGEVWQAVAIGVGVVVLLRMLALRWDIRLPIATTGHADAPPDRSA